MFWKLSSVARCFWVVGIAASRGVTKRFVLCGTVNSRWLAGLMGSQKRRSRAGRRVGLGNFTIDFEGICWNRLKAQRTLSTVWLGREFWQIQACKLLKSEA